MMNDRKQHADHLEHQEKPSTENAEGSQQRLHIDHGNMAYDLLFLQQRLAAYEQLHLEEMAELRQEIERLRRTFLQATNPHLRQIDT
jgi:hypothetical protein